MAIKTQLIQARCSLKAVFARKQLPGIDATAGVDILPIQRGDSGLRTRALSCPMDSSSELQHVSQRFNFAIKAESNHITFRNKVSRNLNPL